MMLTGVERRSEELPGLLQIPSTATRQALRLSIRPHEGNYKITAQTEFCHYFCTDPDSNMATLTISRQIQLT